jgi:hypothetical protein
MHDILAMGARAGALLKERGEMVAVGETSAGGLISASLLAVPGASAYFAGGAVTYSRRSIMGLAGISIEEMRAKGIRSSSEPYAHLLATEIRARHGDITWGLSGQRDPHPAHRPRRPRRQHVGLRRGEPGAAGRGAGVGAALKFAVAELYSSASRGGGCRRPPGE